MASNEHLQIRTAGINLNDSASIGHVDVVNAIGTVAEGEMRIAGLTLGDNHDAGSINVRNAIGTVEGGTVIGEFQEV